MIDYSLINESIIYYENDFKRIETPWLVTEAVDSITRPSNAVPFIVGNKNLVASGEQSFLYLYLKEYLPKGAFQTVTPCFRNDSFDFTHTKYFIKNELIKTDDVSEQALQDVINKSLYFFKKYIPDVYVKKEENSYDIMWMDYELGSYGIRECEFLKWIYGTGCAEPRTSKLIQLYNGLSQQ